MKRLIAVLLLTSLAAAAWATTYVRVEKDGTKTYSDRPIPGGQPIEVQSAQTYSPAPAPAQPQGAGIPPEQRLLMEMGEPFRYESCAPTPETNQSFTNPESVAIGVSPRPTLRAGDVLELRVDGTPVGGANATSYTMSPVARGAHTVTVTIKDRYGRPACEGSSTFHVFQPGLNSPTRRPPPRPRG